VVASSDSQPTSPKPRKKKTVEETYQKLEQREHILQRPDMYVGSVQKTEGTFPLDLSFSFSLVPLGMS
jgi:DNA topoisomerase-2